MSKYLLRHYFDIVHVERISRKNFPGIFLAVYERAYICIEGSKRTGNLYTEAWESINDRYISL
ncbi:hypothetical protein [Metabacillus arenae]|uniref:Uncharacterized protein n=1 Tax=Metabacillus arenae TaxID=2771434 RepID=A0A926RYI3_9BACI|nr:hypothetical protein [Metabacillus arenae]MBD1382968.1 hypothetical protein [Metabacillus arenae]